jgi:hypothetical protein
MATPNQLMPRLEGLVGTGLRAGRAPQRVILWLHLMREIMFSQSLRDASDWAIGVVVDTVNADTEIDGSGGTVYGVLVDSIFDVTDEDLFVVVSDSGGSATFDATSVDLGATVFGPDDGMAILRLPDATGTTDAEFGTWLDPTGQVMANDIHAAADGQEGTAPTTLDVRTYVIYRSDTEARV